MRFANTRGGATAANREPPRGQAKASLRHRSSGSERHAAAVVVEQTQRFFIAQVADPEQLGLLAL